MYLDDRIKRIEKAYCLAKLEKKEEALALYEAALVKAPEYLTALTGKGTLLMSIGRKEEADKVFKKIEELMKKKKQRQDELQKSPLEAQNPNDKNEEQEENTM